MSKSLYVKITQGQALGPYSIYYDTVQPSNYAVLYGTTTPATNVPLAALTAGSGLRVTIPDSAISVILQNANGDCLNYRDYAIVSFSNISTVCTGYYDGTATINVTISGKSGQYQYSKDGGTTFSAATTSKTYAFTNVANGDYNIAVKRVADGVVSFYQSNPVAVECTAVLSATYLAPCRLTPPPDDQLFGDIVIYATGGSEVYEYAIKNLQTSVIIGPQESNSFLDLDPTGQYEMYVYDVDNPVTPDYKLTVGTVTFTCPDIPDPLVFTATPSCGPTGYPGTGKVTAAGFQGGSEIYMYVSFGNSLQLAQDRLDSVTERIALEGATSYVWSNLANNTVGTPNYYVGLQDSGGRKQFVQVAPVSCTTPEPPNYQFLAYNLALNSCTKTGTGVKYWTYDATFAAGYYKLNGGSTLLKLESTATTSDRGTKIDSFEALTCLSSYVTLVPLNSVPPTTYTLYVNGTPYPDFDSNSRSYPVGSVIKLVYDGPSVPCGNAPVCGVSLKTTAGSVINTVDYASGTEITIVLNTDYEFTIKNYNNWVDYGQPYCQENQTRQNIINDCACTSYRIVSPCYTACTNTTYSETCSGTYGQNVLRTVYYACNGQATGQTSTYTCGPCSSPDQAWVVEGYACNGGCTKWALERQMNPCAAGYNTTRERDTGIKSCDCGETCLNTYEVNPPTCDPNNPTTAIYVTRYTCYPNSIVSSRTQSCSPACNANTIPNWVSEGAAYCSSCVKKQLQRQINPCADGYQTTRVVNSTDGNPTCECGPECLGTETYNFCGGTQGKTYYTVQRYVCPPNTYTTTPSVVGTCLPGTCGVSTSPQYDPKNYSACYQPSCTAGPVYQDINYCSPTYNNYFIEISGNKINVGTGQPTQGACNTASSCQSTGTSYCSGTSRIYPQYQANPCSGVSCPPVVVENSPLCSATVRIYGARTSGTGGARLFYGINNAACPDGGGTLTTAGNTAGSPLYTIAVPFGATLYFQATDASDVTVYHCSQQATASYCTSYDSCTSSFTINGNTDISVKAYTTSTCTP